MQRNFTWDGEKIAETIKEEKRKHTPKEILNHLDGLKNNINQIESSLEKNKEQKKQLESDLKQVKEIYKDLEKFEKDCEQIQVDKLKSIIADIQDESIKKAVEKSEETISKDPVAYSDNQKKQLPYLEYQKLIATNPKVQEKISNRIIKKYLYEEPVFENPF